MVIVLTEGNIGSAMQHPLGPSVDFVDSFNAFYWCVHGLHLLRPPMDFVCQINVFADVLRYGHYRFPALLALLSFLVSIFLFQTQSSIFASSRQTSPLLPIPHLSSPYFVSLWFASPRNTSPLLITLHTSSQCFTSPCNTSHLITTIHLFSPQVTFPHHTSHLLAILPPLSQCFPSPYHISFHYDSILLAIFHNSLPQIIPSHHKLPFPTILHSSSKSSPLLTTLPPFSQCFPSPHHTFPFLAMISLSLPHFPSPRNDSPLVTTLPPFSQ